jgi:hypothetical protein
VLDVRHHEGSVFVIELILFARVSRSVAFRATRRTKGSEVCASFGLQASDSWARDELNT